MSLKGTAAGQTLVGSINKCEVLTISAYGIAVKNGFKGTEEEWQASLKGAPGYTPQRGTDYWTPDDQQEIDNHIAEEVAALGDHSTIVCEAEGETILLTDSAKAKLRGLKLCGKSEQFTTTGANLLNPALYDAKTTYSDTGIEATVNADGSFTITGTADENDARGIMFTHYLGEYIDILEDGKTYGGYIFGALGEKLSIALTFRVTVNGSDTYMNPITVDKSTMTSIRPYVQPKVSEYTEGMTIYPMLSEGTTASSYEPYTGGKPSPSPEYPQEIVSAGADGEIGVKVCGANLLHIDDSTITASGITVACADGVVTVTGTKESGWDGMGIKGTLSGAKAICDLPPGTYYISGDVTIQIMLASGGDKYAQNSYFTIEDGDYVCYLYCSFTTGEAVNKTLYPMINKGTTALPWEPYKGNTLTALTPNGLPGIKVSSGGNYTDSTGQQWISNVKDFGMGVEIPWVVPVTFDGSDDELWGNGYTSDGVNNRFECKLPSDSGFGVWVATGNTVVGSPCDRFNFEMTSAIPSVNGCRTVYSATINALYVLCNPSTEIVPLEDVDAWRAFLSASPITMLLPVLNPTETPLSAEEMAQYAALLTNYPTTTVLNDEGVGMNVSYVADTKNYIDKKFTELAAAIVANA